MKTIAWICLLLASAVVSAKAQDALTGYTGTVTLQGSITGAGTATIRAYNNGLVTTNAESGVTGDYTVTFELSGERDETVVVWFLSDKSDMIPELLIVKESSLARRNGVWSRCIPRVKAQDVVIYNVNFRSEKDLLKSLQDDDCFDE